MAYDWLGRRLTQELLHDASEQDPNSYSFAYDANGNVATRTDAKNQTITYAGNITSKSDVGNFTYANIHPQAVTGANGVAYAYETNGSLTGDGTWTHTWDNRNQVSSSTDGTTTVAYGYDESWRRISKDDGATETLYINKYFDKEGSNDVAYVYGNNLKLATVKGSDSALHHLDHLSGSNISIDVNGDTLELNDYYPFGSSRIDQWTGGYTNNNLFPKGGRIEVSCIVTYELENLTGQKKGESVQ
jgi:YD repeat-containing protein